MPKPSQILQEIIMIRACHTCVVSKTCARDQLHIHKRRTYLPNPKFCLEQRPVVVPIVPMLSFPVWKSTTDRQSLSVPICTQTNQYKFLCECVDRHTQQALNVSVPWIHKSTTFLQAGLRLSTLTDVNIALAGLWNIHLSVPRLDSAEIFKIREIDRQLLVRGLLDRDRKQSAFITLGIEMDGIRRDASGVQREPYIGRYSMRNLDLVVRHENLFA